MAILFFYLRKSRVATSLPPKADTQSRPKVTLKDLAEFWLKSVEDNNPKLAIQVAGFLIRDQKSDLVVDPWYVELMHKNGISRKFLTDKFNIYDFIYWKHACFFKRIAEKVEGNSDAEIIKNLVNLVHQHIKPISFDSDEVVLPYTIWQKRKGLCDKQCWVLAELAYQLGYETRIIWLMDPVSHSSPHTICEIRKHDFTAIADPFSNISLPGYTIFSLAGNEKLLKEIWPEKEIWRRSVNECLLMIPAAGQDYCLRNQLLYSKLRQLLGDKCPRFGTDPKTRKLQFEKLQVNKAFLNNPKYRKGLYSYPLVSLRKLLSKH